MKSRMGEIFDRYLNLSCSTLICTLRFQFMVQIQQRIKHHIGVISFYHIICPEPMCDQVSRLSDCLKIQTFKRPLQVFNLRLESNHLIILISKFKTHRLIYCIMAFFYHLMLVHAHQGVHIFNMKYS